MGRAMELKDIPESAVIQQVKQILKVTGLKNQHRAFCSNRVQAAEWRAIKPSAKRAYSGHQPQGRRGVRCT